MNLDLTPELRAFREEVRAFIRAELPADIKEKVKKGLHLGMMLEDKQLAPEPVVEQASPEEVIAWAVRHYFPKLTMATAFGPEGCVILSILAKIEPRVYVFNLDTGYQFKETLELRDRIAERYGIAVDLQQPDVSVEDYERQNSGPVYLRDPDKSGYQPWVKRMRYDAVKRGADLDVPQHRLGFGKGAPGHALAGLGGFEFGPCQGLLFKEGAGALEIAVRLFKARLRLFQASFDFLGIEAGHEVTAFSLGPPDPSTVGNPNYTIRGKTIRIRGLEKFFLTRKLGKMTARPSRTKPTAEKVVPRSMPTILPIVHLPRLTLPTSRRTAVRAPRQGFKKN